MLIIFGKWFINRFIYDTLYSPFLLLHQTVPMLTFKFLSPEIFFCGVPVRNFKWCLTLARFLSLVGPGNSETASLAFLNNQRHWWLSSKSLGHEDWGKCAKNFAVSAVAMKIILTIFLANGGNSTGQQWIMADIWPPLRATHNLQRKPYDSNISHSCG